jgi:hypothetical protein
VGHVPLPVAREVHQFAPRFLASEGLAISRGALHPSHDSKSDRFDWVTAMAGSVTGLPRLRIGLRFAQFRA